MRYISPKVSFFSQKPHLTLSLLLKHLKEQERETHAHPQRKYRNSYWVRSFNSIDILRIILIIKYIISLPPFLPLVNGIKRTLIFIYLKDESSFQPLKITDAYAH